MRDAVKLGLVPLWCLLLGSGRTKDTVSVGAHAPGQPASLKGAGWEGVRQLGFSLLQGLEPGCLSFGKALRLYPESRPRPLRDGVDREG